MFNFRTTLKLKYIFYIRNMYRNLYTDEIVHLIFQTTCDKREAVAPGEDPDQATMN